MQLIKYPSRMDWPSVLLRPGSDDTHVRTTVSKILATVLSDGDAALKKYTLEFDSCAIDEFKVSPDCRETEDKISQELKDAIDIAIGNITLFHKSQLETITRIETMPGVSCWRKPVGIERVGLYIPGGSAALFSTLLMLAIPAKIAGCGEIILCTPPDASGNISPAILYAAQQTGITEVYRVGGAQAIAAMAFGTDSIPKVSKIFGPGNKYVTYAKMLAQMEGVAIDMPAGPSELAILADKTSVPAYVAADLLSQAEHGPDSQVILVCDSEETIHEVQMELSRILEQLPRAAIASAALQHSKAILVNTIDEGMDLVNEYAPEHLIIACENDEEWAEKVINAGSVFLGNYSPESAGDYASGTNHTLPTNGYAKAYSGVSVDSFLRKITFQKITRTGLANIAQTVITMAEAEGLQAHAYAIIARSQS